MLAPLTTVLPDGKRIRIVEKMHPDEVVAERLAKAIVAIPRHKRSTKGITFMPTTFVINAQSRDIL